MNAVMNEPSAAALLTRYRHLQTQKPQQRVREAASELGVSEAELVAAEGTTRLREDWPALLARLPQLGRVMCLTRNESCVHERFGAYQKVEVNGGMALVLGPDIDLRLFLRRWKFGFACIQALHSGTRQSLQFFDAQGVAIQKIYLTDESNTAAFAALLTDFGIAGTALKIEPAPAPVQDRRDSEIDVEGLREAWRGLRDTHDFFGLLNKFQVGRLQALRLAGVPLARPVPPDFTYQMLQAVSARGEQIMVFVANPGCIQIHSGPAKKIARKGPWLNILDEDFNLHLREDRVMHSWVVRKPTEDGVITALELYDEEHQLVAQFFGARKPGIAERAGWRDIVARLEAGDAA